MKTSTLKSNLKKSGKVPSRPRIDALRHLLSEGTLSTQEELVEKLEKQHYQVTQSTVSRDLRKLGAIRAIDNEGRTVYRLPEEFFTPIKSTSLREMVTRMSSNGHLIVIRTHPGSASLVGRFIDMTFSDQILGCIAGDDTVFVAPENTKEIKDLLNKIETGLSENQ